MPYDTFKFDPQEIKKLEEMEETIQGLMKEVEKFKRIGIDATNLENKLKAAKTLKDNLLKEFANN